MNFDEELLSCPTCGGGHLPVLARDGAGQAALTYVICTTCGLIAMSPRYSEAAAAKFYSKDYRTTPGRSESPSQASLTEQRQRAHHQVTLLQRQRRTYSSHLDIGCSTGALLSVSGERLETDRRVGVEPGDAHRELAMRAVSGASIYAGLADVPNLGPFDLITASHVLEHLHQPVTFLRALRTRLHPEGLLLVEVPNFYGHISFEIGHLFAYTSSTLAHALGAAGFRVIDRAIHAVPRRRHGHRYITVVAKPGPRTAPSHRLGISPAVVQMRRALSFRVEDFIKRVTSDYHLQPPTGKSPKVEAPL
jgi:2-polyprenyl-3-methyl-5-hydroxy-6-metoxy-1,4-benzoquinol methylase